MKTNSSYKAMFVFAVAVLFLTPRAFAQRNLGERDFRETNIDRPNLAPRNFDRRIALKKLLDGVNQLSPHVRQHLSPGMQNYLRYANTVVNAPAPSAIIRRPQFGLIRRSSPLLAASGPGGTIQVSNPAMDPKSEGYTQSTTSSAWCGNSVVVGYEDTGAFYRTNPSDTIGVPMSLDGLSFSTNSGNTFTDLGYLTPGTFSANALLGSPVVTCTNASDFQYASILNTTTPDGLNPIIGPSISFSTNAGKAWSSPLQTIAFDGNTELADKPWLAVDSTNPRHMCLTYTHIIFQGCISIELLRSVDAGKTWSQPTVIDSDCDNLGGILTGSSVVVSPNGSVYVAYESLPAPSSGTSVVNNAIFFASSSDSGKTFKRYKITDVVPGGDAIALNGNVLVNEYPHLAVDRSSRSSRGTIYISWPDGRDKIVPDPGTTTGTYAYPDIFVAKSNNLGRSFTVLGAVSPTPKTFSGIGRDQFLPGIAVDRTGAVGVCYYDRRNDRNNLRVDRYCSVSTNQGRTWSDIRASNLNWMPANDPDPLDPTPGDGIGKYDTVASDFLSHASGFFAAFEVEITGKPEVVAKKF